MTATPATVLVVDDDATLRRTIESALAGAGYRAVGAGGAETAYELLSSLQPDAVLLDIRLPTMSGLALYLAIVNRWPTLTGRIAIMTGDAEADEVRAWLERNPCAVLRKPFNLRQIFQWLDVVLAAPGRESGNG